MPHTSCYICGNSNLTPILSFGNQPPSDAFLRPEDLPQPETSYPLDLFFCSSCTLVQLGYAVDPQILFRDYVYNSDTNDSLRINFKELVEEAVQTYGVTSEDFAVDIGSNDGTLLENYLLHGIKVLGVDPSSATSIALERGIPTLVEFFTEEVAQRIKKEHGSAKIITATNVFAHVVELDSLMRGTALLLDEKGVFISESGYVVDMVEGMQYDSIYHEHLRYYSVHSLAALFEKYGMEIISVVKISSHGGSLRVFAAKKGAHASDGSARALLAQEKAKGYHDRAVYDEFATRVAQTKEKLLSIVSSLKKSGAHIAGIGAPAKGNTLLNYCRLGPDTIEYLAEKSPLKIGRYSPGMRIPVVDESRIFAEQPEAALLLSWNIADLLVPKLRELGYKGVFIIPNPEPKVID